MTRVCVVAVTRAVEQYSSGSAAAQKSLSYNPLFML
jgi:hypothetical protein